MSTSFDPYSQWLGIAEGPRPPDFYSLLGLLPTERDAAAVSRAADMQLARLRQVRPGEWATVWSRLLDEIQEAKRCLTDPQAKAVYDAAIAARVATLESSGLVPSGNANRSIPVALAAMPPLGVAVEATSGLGVRVPFPVGYSQPATIASANAVADPPLPLPVAAGLPAWPGGGVPAMAGVPAAAVADLPTNRLDGQSVGNATTASISFPLPQPVSEVGGLSPLPLPMAQRAGSVFPQSVPATAPLGSAAPQPTQPAPNSMPSLPVAMNVATAASGARPTVSQPARSSGGLFAVLRWSVVGFLLITLGVLSVMLYHKLQDEAERRDSDGKKTELAQSDNGTSGNGAGARGTTPAGANQRPPKNNGTAMAGAPGGALGSNDARAKTSPVSTPTEDPASAHGATGLADPSNSRINRPDDTKPATPINGGRPNDPSPASDDPQKRAAFKKSLSEARVAMAEREYADAKKALAAAASLAQTADDRKELQRLDQLEAHLDGFWKSIRDVMPKIDGTEMPIGNTFISIVEADDHHVLVKAAGQMRRYGVGTPDMPIKLITAIAEQRFKSDTTWNALYGTFHAMDRDGDRGKARQLWSQAGKLGADLLPELDVPRQSAISPPNGASSSAGGTRSPAEQPPAATDFGATIAELQQQAEAAKAVSQHSEVARKALAECQRACAAKRWDDALKLAQIAQGAARESKSPALLRQAYAAVQQIEAVRKER